MILYKFWCWTYMKCSKYQHLHKKTIYKQNNSFVIQKFQIIHRLFGDSEFRSRMDGPPAHAFYKPCLYLTSIRAAIATAVATASAMMPCLALPYLTLSYLATTALAAAEEAHFDNQRHHGHLTLLSLSTWQPALLPVGSHKRNTSRPASSCSAGSARTPHAAQHKNHVD